MLTYKSNWLRSSWIYIISVVITAYTVFLSIVASYTIKPDRYKIDKWLQEWAKRLMHAAKINYSVSYETPITWENDQPYIILSNHTSLFDIPLIYLALPGSIRMLAKKELTKIPFFGQAMKVNGFIIIDRHDRTQAIKDLEIAKKQLQSGIKLWAAPEGTRSPTGKLLPFKKGAFMVALQTGATIIPVGIKGSNKVLPAKSLHFNLNQNVEINVGTPIDASQYTIETRAALMDKVRDSIAKLADVPLIEKTTANITH